MTLKIPKPLDEKGKTVMEVESHDEAQAGSDDEDLFIEEGQ